MGRFFYLFLFLFHIFLCASSLHLALGANPSRINPL
jgi:hypothetical protein